MVNILFVDDNYNYSKNLINKVMEQNSDVRLFKFLTDGREALQVIMNEFDKIDIILLDLKLPEYSGIDILKKIDDEKIFQYKNSIIVLSGEPEMIQKIRNSPYVYTFIPKGNGFESALNKNNDLIKLKNFSKDPIENQIIRELKKINYNFSYIGTQYIYESILILCSSYRHEKIKLEKQVYPLIADKYHTTINTIKTNIVNSTNEMYYDCQRDILNSYFGLCDNEKPTPKEVMSLIVSNIKHPVYF